MIACQRNGESTRLGLSRVEPVTTSRPTFQFFYQRPGITFARSKREAVSKAFKKAHRDYPESEGYSNHQAVALEVTHDFLDLAHKLSPLPKKDPRRGEHAIRGEAVETEEEIAIDVDTDM